VPELARIGDELPVTELKQAADVGDFSRDSPIELADLLFDPKRFPFIPDEDTRDVKLLTCSYLVVETDSLFEAYRTYSSRDKSGLVDAGCPEAFPTRVLSVLKQDTASDMAVGVDFVPSGPDPSNKTIKHCQTSLPDR
jgi:hypothetical protein